jgi:hypothetical protein
VGVDPHRVLETTLAASEHVDRPAPPDTSALVAESRMLLRWLESARLVDIDGEWTQPISRAARS